MGEVLHFLCHISRYQSQHLDACALCENIACVPHLLSDLHEFLLHVYLPSCKRGQGQDPNKLNGVMSDLSILHHFGQP